MYLDMYVCLETFNYRAIRLVLLPSRRSLASSSVHPMMGGARHVERKGFVALGSFISYLWGQSTSNLSLTESGVWQGGGGQDTFLVPVASGNPALSISILVMIKCVFPMLWCSSTLSMFWPVYYQVVLLFFSLLLSVSAPETDLLLRGCRCWPFWCGFLHNDYCVSVPFISEDMLQDPAGGTPPRSVVQYTLYMFLLWNRRVGWRSFRPAVGQGRRCDANGKRRYVRSTAGCGIR